MQRRRQVPREAGHTQLRGRREVRLSAWQGELLRGSHTAAEGSSLLNRRLVGAGFVIRRSGGWMVTGAVMLVAGVLVYGQALAWRGEPHAVMAGVWALGVGLACSGALIGVV